MVTDGEPTAHFEPGVVRALLRVPARARRPSTPRCARSTAARSDGIRINTFVLDATSYLRHFVDTLTKLNGGRAFFTTNDALGDYVLHDFVEHRKARRGAARAF